MPPKKRVKARRENREFKLPLWAELRTPTGISPLAEFVQSCEGEVSPEEAVREYQQDWCDHPKESQQLISSLVKPTEEEAVYHLACTECGLIRVRKSRPVNAA